MSTFLDFEKPIEILEKRLNELKEFSASNENNCDLLQEIKSLEKRRLFLINEIYKNLTPWQRVKLSRHPNRPYTEDYIKALFKDFKELSGDRYFGDDKAIIAGIATWFDILDKKQISVVIVGHQKGRTISERRKRNFGMSKPEGYRKAIRMFDLAERFRMPILTFIDTPGAAPDVEAEKRGQAQAIAECIEKMFELTVPIASVIIGEGGSGGAIAISSSNLILMQEYSTYSVISPEGCASILWNDKNYAKEASEALKLTSNDLKNLGIIDSIIPEPIGGAHRNWKKSFEIMQKHLEKNFNPIINKMDSEGFNSNIKRERMNKFRVIGKNSISLMNNKSE